LIGENLDEKRQHALLDEFFSGVKDGKIVVLEGSAVNGDKAEVTSALPLTQMNRRPSGINCFLPWRKMQRWSSKSTHRFWAVWSFEWETRSWMDRSRGSFKTCGSRCGNTELSRGFQRR